MTYTDDRRTAARPPRRRGGGGWVALVILLVVLGVLAWLLLGGGFDQLASGGAEPSEPDVAEPVDVSLDELLEDAEVNDDGSVTVTVSEAEAGGLMRRALERGGDPVLDDVTVDLQKPDGAAPGQMALAGTLPDRDVPVTAVIDLDIDDGEVRPTVRDVRVGPLPVPAGLAQDLNDRLADVGLLADQDIAVEDLSTTERRMKVTGRQD